jgi:hypothetical protein
MNPDQLFDSPDLFLLSFEEKDAIFIDMDRAAYNRSVFLDGRISPRSQTLRRIPLAQLEELSARYPLGEVGYIYHVAHCGSTLLARALDLPDSNLVLREPMALRQLGVQGAARFGADPGETWRRRARLAHQMFARRYAQGAATVVKANVPVNFIIPEFNDIAGAPPSIAIYFSLEDYLVAILRSPNHRRWVESVSGEVRPAITELTGVAAAQSGAEAAALLWLAQMRIYHQLMVRNDRAVSVNAEDVFNRPGDVIAAAFAHFGQPQSPALVERITQSDLFAHYSKNPKVAFTNAARLERKRAMRAEIQPELDQARALIERLPPAHTLPERLPRDLLGGEGARLLEVNP